MRTVVVAVLLLLTPMAAAETPLFFVGDGTSEMVVKGALTSNIYPMSKTGMGTPTTFTTVAGNSNNNNPYLPTYVWSEEPLSLVADDVITVHHWAAVRGGAASAAGCGLIGALYNPGGSIIKQQTVLATGQSRQEFVFTFTGIEGEFPNLRFQPVQNSNQCGWATIEHAWGSAAAAGRMIVPTEAFAPRTVASEGPSLPSITYTDLDAPDLALQYVNATSGTHVYNFTVDANSTVLQFDINATGDALAILTDAVGVEHHNGTVVPTNRTLEAVAPGTWSLRLELTDFTGSLAFRLAAVPSAVPDAQHQGNETAAPAGNETADSTIAEEAPGLPMVALLLSVVIAAIVVRRR